MPWTTERRSEVVGRTHRAARRHGYGGRRGRTGFDVERET